jgi:hypothetical protein
MSLGSPANIIPFTRFLECRQRRHRIAIATATAVMPASTDVGIRPEVTGTSNDDDPSSNGNADRKTIQSIRVKVIGCVAGGMKPVITGSQTPFPAAMTSRQPPGRWGGQAPDRTFPSRTARRSTSSVGDLKAHMGHEVEVIGITSDTKSNKSASCSSAIGSSTQEKATLTVSSVKMIAAKCP